MSTTDGFLILDTQKSMTMAEPCPRSVARRKLADISNLPQRTMLLIKDEKSQSMSTATKEYTEQLRKENMALVKMLAQRNKIIEQSGIELDKLRVNLLKMQEQNQQLALSNTQMLAELNSGKDRLKALQHELGCKNGLLKARKLELEEKESAKSCQNAGIEARSAKFQEEGETSKEGGVDEKPRRTKRSLQSNSLSSCEQIESKEKAEIKRPFVRRQSARLKATESKPAEDLNEIDDAKISKCPSPNDPVPEDASTSVHASVKIEDNDCSSGHINDSQQFGRSSLCRPSRHAAKKVQSYKEIPLNAKMRRSE